MSQDGPGRDSNKGTPRPGCCRAPMSGLHLTARTALRTTAPSSALEAFSSSVCAFSAGARSRAHLPQPASGRALNDNHKAPTTVSGKKNAAKPAGVCCCGAVPASLAARVGSRLMGRGWQPNVSRCSEVAMDGVTIPDLKPTSYLDSSFMFWFVGVRNRPCGAVSVVRRRRQECPHRLRIRSCSQAVRR